MGGKWTDQNKVIPGVYINYLGTAPVMASLGTRGVATMPVALDWGKEGEVIEIFSTDLTNGQSEAKIGYTSFDIEALTVIECLKYTQKLLAYRINGGGDKAQAIITTGVAPDPVLELTVEALYSGIAGNEITIVIAESVIENKFDVITLYRGKEKNRQTILTLDELIDNEWVTFTGTGEPPLTAGATLTGGTNGTIETTNYADYIAAVENKYWNTMGIPSVDETLSGSFIAMIKDRRDNKGMKSQVVLYNSNTADFEGVISVNQGYKTKVAEISKANFVATITGMTAGASKQTSNTGRVLTDAIEIIDEVPINDLETKLKTGHFLIGFTSEGKVEVIKDINTFVSFTQEKPYVFSKNQPIRILDSIDFDIQALFNKSFKGKAMNSPRKRDILKASIGALILTGYVRLDLVANFTPSEDINVAEGQNPDAVKVDISAEILDSMEIMYTTIYLK